VPSRKKTEGEMGGEMRLGEEIPTRGKRINLVTMITDHIREEIENNKTRRSLDRKKRVNGVEFTTGGLRKRGGEVVLGIKKKNNKIYPPKLDKLGAGEKKP